MLLEKENLLLASLHASDRNLVVSQATAIDLPLRKVLFEAETMPEFAYFLTDGIASTVASTRSGQTAEVAVAGREGLVGAMHLLGPASVQTRCFMQVRGSGLQIRLSTLRDLFRSAEGVRERILEFVQQQTLFVSQIAGCNRLHGSEERLARWLLVVCDRLECSTLDITQEFLADMLGSQRTTVTMSAGALQRRGLIEHRHGRVTIVNREGLESAACDCYQVAKHLYANLYKRGAAVAVNHHGAVNGRDFVEG